MTGLLGAVVPAPVSLALKAAPYAAIGVLALLCWHFNARAVANADAVRTQAAQFAQAQATATATYQAALAHQQALYQQDAIHAQATYQTQLAAAQSATDRYIATHRVQPATAQSGTGSTTTVAHSNGSAVPAPVSADSVVAVSDADVRACTDATIYAVRARAYVLSISQNR